MIGWMVLLVLGSFSLGTIVGIALKRDAQAHEATGIPWGYVPHEEPLDGVRLVGPAPFGVAPLDRPWDWERDGEAS